ncbi:MAG TPA: hypothetical protein VK338_00615 [Candidatus Nitrosocosmicus sp.]|nr:hypothetical protein [Candidatus Nitrosocosmicus sp.]
MVEIETIRYELSQINRSPNLKKSVISYQAQKFFHASSLTDADKLNFAVEILEDPDGIEAVAELFGIRYVSPDLPDRLAQLAGLGHAVDLVSNHTCHGDGIGLARVCNVITNKARKLHYDHPDMYLEFDGFYLPVAQSLVNGHQDDGDPLQKKRRLYEASLPYLNRNHIITVGIPRDRSKNETDDWNKELTREFKDHSLVNARGVLIFAEGTTEGGRYQTSENGVIIEPPRLNGLQKPPALGQFLSAKILNGSSVFVPIAIDGSYRIFDPNGYKITKEAVRITARNLFFSQFPQSLATVTVGNPIVFSELDKETQNMLVNACKNKDYDTVTEFYMLKIAELLPEYAWGYYADAMKARSSV